jgi:SAM-dependent methyltransferase
MKAEEELILSCMALEPHNRVLDAGGGVGRFTLLMAPLVEHVLCADLSHGSLALLEQTVKRRSMRNISCVQADLCSLPGSLGKFDKACSIGVIQHIPSHQARLDAIRSIRAALRPGGSFLMTVICWNFRVTAGFGKEGFWGEGDRRLYRYYFTVQEARQLLLDAGFVDVEARGLLVLPKRLTDRLPASMTWLERVIAKIPAFSGYGRDVLVIGRVPVSA